MGLLRIICRRSVQFHALIDVYLLLAEVYHDMGEHFVDIPAAVYKTQMIVSAKNDEP